MVILQLQKVMPNYIYDEYFISIFTENFDIAFERICFVFYRNTYKIKYYETDYILQIFKICTMDILKIL
jgi:hypothetical protein